MEAPDPLQDLSLAFEDALQRTGLHGALRFLNGRTPHRFTGVYRYDGPMLRNVSLFDQFNPEQARGDDSPIGATFCSLVPRFGGALTFSEACNDPRVSQIQSPVVSYCGVQLRDEAGTPLGTLCHFDLKPCETRTSDLEFLETVAPLLQRTMMAFPIARA
ncbi:MAG: GAF domain-containing protein [Lysobacter sp.]|nr:GAF domain-containing protein [Lysobacter sp.]MDQ3269774.1 GAF domain-containing protein [Pseudomonadota bacterium]